MKDLTADQAQHLDGRSSTYWYRFRRSRKVSAALSTITTPSENIKITLKIQTLRLPYAERGSLELFAFHKVSLPTS
jgi:hypothetical protein